MGGSVREKAGDKVLELHVFGCLDLRDANLIPFDHSDPYCAILVGGAEISRTRVVRDDLNPLWWHCCQIECVGASDDVHLVVKDHNYIKRRLAAVIPKMYTSAGGQESIEDVDLGSAVFNTAEVPLRPFGYLGYLRLSGAHLKTSGYIMVSARWMPTVQAQLEVSRRLLPIVESEQAQQGLMNKYGGPALSYIQVKNLLNSELGLEDSVPCARRLLAMAFRDAHRHPADNPCKVGFVDGAGFKSILESLRQDLDRPTDATPSSNREEKRASVDSVFEERPCLERLHMPGGHEEGRQALLQRLADYFEVLHCVLPEMAHWVIRSIFLARAEISARSLAQCEHFCKAMRKTLSLLSDIQAALEPLRACLDAVGSALSDGQSDDAFYKYVALRRQEATLPGSLLAFEAFHDHLRTWADALGGCGPLIKNAGRIRSRKLEESDRIVRLLQSFALGAEAVSYRRSVRSELDAAIAQETGAEEGGEPKPVVVVGLRAALGELVPLVGSDGSEGEGDQASAEEEAEVSAYLEDEAQRGAVLAAIKERVADLAVRTSDLTAELSMLKKLGVHITGQCAPLTQDILAGSLAP